MMLTFILVCLFVSSGTVWGRTSSYYDAGRVVGGETAPEGAYPHMIALLLEGQFTCGASILSEGWALTAAHCVGRPPTSYAIRAGSNQHDEGGQLRKVRQIIIHEDYETVYHRNDVALLKIDRLLLGARLQSIPVDTTRVEPQSYVQLSGWGLLSYPGDIPDDLQQITLKVVRNDLYCKDSVEFCTLNKAGEGVCSGDSGSPIIRKVGGVNKQVGVTSKSGQLCARGKPDIFARVSAFVSWIQKNCNNCAST